MRFLILFILLISNVLANEAPNIKNLVINNELKTYDNITFLDSNEKIIRLSDYKGNLVLLNFWATWCLPCKKEMPSLDDLKAKTDRLHRKNRPYKIQHLLHVQLYLISHTSLNLTQN